jgi:hypothetical protein
MENVIEKLNQIQDSKSTWDNWSLEDLKQLLDIYFIISKNESHIFNLIYSFHGCDSWEDIFRNYNINYFEEKAAGVEVAINEIINEQIKQTKKTN